MESSDDTVNPPTVPGSCLCGAVRFEIALPTRLCVHCHCSMCRRNHGAAFVTWFAVAKENFRLVEGEAALSQYASSQHGMRSFCSRCGSSLFCVLDRDPDQIDVTLASMLAPIDRSPQAHVFFDSHVEWVELADSLPKLPVS
jgi:hypothetical protein